MDLYPITIGCICRECGALCTMQTFEDTEGLCYRCTYRRPPIRSAFINGEEVVGEVNIRRALLDLRRDDRPLDPIQDAIRRATVAWFVTSEQKQ